MRFEQERTWDSKRRLNTWEKNDAKFNKGISNGTDPTKTAASAKPTFL